MSRDSRCGAAAHQGTFACELPADHDSAHSADLGAGVIMQWLNLGAEHPRRTRSLGVRGPADSPDPHGLVVGPSAVLARGSYSHDVLIHDTDHELVAGTVAFVEQGLRAGATVLVHGSEERVALLRPILGRDPRLTYGFDRDLYRQPMRTLFNYEREVAARVATGEFWVTGTVPFHTHPGTDPATDAAWRRYESLVNEVLADYPFHALCTYDTRALPASTIAAARVTHPWISDGTNRAESPSYLVPAAFVVDPRAAALRPPDAPPDATTNVYRPRDLHGARDRIARTADAAPGISRARVDEFILAVNEVLTNGLQHGRPPIALSMWIEPHALTCLVVDQGPGIANPVVGYRGSARPTGLHIARRCCDELTIGNTATGGCSVLLTTGP